MIPDKPIDWPPQTTIHNWWIHLAEWEAWYSGSPAVLEGHYRQRADKAHAVPFWATVAKHNERAIHMPLAGDIAGLSSSLLFSEPPKIEYAAANEARMTEIAEANNLESLLLEGSEMAAALSGVYLKIDADPNASDYPILSALKPSGVIPFFHRRTMTGITLWRVVKIKDGKHWYLFEDRQRVEAGGDVTIQYALMTGTEGRIEARVEMDSIEETAGLGLEDTSIALKGGLGIVYIPNLLPNKLSPGSALGVSDYSGSVGLLDALDEAWTCWMRDVRLGMGRLLARGDLSNPNTGEFDPFRSIFLKLDLGQMITGKEQQDPITPIQFDMRTEEHEKTCFALVKEIASRCGYSPQSFGLDIDGRAESGTALRIRERKSLTTRGKKARFWIAGLKDLLTQVQLFDAASGLNPGGPVSIPDVDLEDSIAPSLAETAVAIKDLNMAKAISTEMSVRMVHADWSDAQVMEEVDKIQRDQTLLSPVDLTGIEPGGDEPEE